MEPGAILARVVFGYGFLLVLTRVAGKRSVRQVTPVDLAAALILGDLVDDLLWAEVPAAQFVVAAGAVTFLGVLVTALSRVSPRFRAAINGSPSVLVRDGALEAGSLAAARMPAPDVMALLREQRVTDLREVRSGTLETSGQLGLSRRPWAREAQRADAAAVIAAAEAEP